MARFYDRTMSVEPSGNGAVHCHLVGDPVSWLLALYGRAAWEDLLRTGRVQVIGGDGALGARFKRLIRNQSPRRLPLNSRAHLVVQEVVEFFCDIVVEW